MYIKGVHCSSNIKDVLPCILRGKNVEKGGKKEGKKRGKREEKEIKKVVVVSRLNELIVSIVVLKIGRPKPAHPACRLLLLLLL